MKVFLNASDLDCAACAFPCSSNPGASAWDDFRGRYLSLPEWFPHGLDPLSLRYAQQQDRLWSLISGRVEAYRPELHEDTPEVEHLDGLVQPGLYLQDTVTAGHHLIALGHLVMLSGIRPGGRVLEYGAGFGQIALAFARLGAVVDTVDINPHFCDKVSTQARLFKVPLTAHQGEFGFNPNPGVTYDLIVFYESFHHARDFLILITRVHGLLADGGRLLLAGEPVVQLDSLAVPYPWGIRLDMESAAVVRIRGWYEIGFQEDFLLRSFVQQGFITRKHPGQISEYATVYEFRKRPAVVKLGDWPLLPADDITWHPIEPNGRWTTNRSTFCLDQNSDWRSLTVSVWNFHATRLLAGWSCGTGTAEIALKPREQRVLEIPRGKVADTLEFTSETLVPRSYGIADDRSLGLFVEQIEYCS
jgi:SAM-dependent methyltransferase